MNEFYYNIGQILKVVHKKNFKNIDLYQWPVTDIRDRIYNSIPGVLLHKVCLPDVDISVVVGGSKPEKNIVF